MSLLDIHGTSPPPTPHPRERFHPGVIALMGDSAIQSQQNGPPNNAVDAHCDARAVVRLVQCPQCSLPLRIPITLPCGNSICRQCLPQTYKRENISYPMTADRFEGFTCPFSGCAEEHSMGDCSQDVTLSKVMERISIEVAHHRPRTVDTPTLLTERRPLQDVVGASDISDTGRSRILNGGRLLATYTMAEIGELRYDAELSYQTMSSNGDDYGQLDVAMLGYLKEATNSEFECQVCYALMLDPLTTTCGHTFCRKCVARVLDHSRLCPICRRTLLMRPGVPTEASNNTLSRLLAKLCPEHVAARAEAAAQEEAAMQGDRNVPLFVCTLAYPTMPTFLHIFEPRYRLMIRRAVENGDRKFGMMMYNRRGEVQGDLGATQFMRYGTLLHIVSVEMLSDGRSLIEARGVSRFRLNEWGMLDGYIVGNVQRLDDVPLAEEEQREIQETTNPVPPPPNDIAARLDRMSTNDLLGIGTGFVTRMRAASAPWLHERVIAAYGQPPNDPAIFPYWFASILPISDEEKYKLLPTTSVRDRLKLTAQWVRKIEAHQWVEATGSDEDPNSVEPDDSGRNANPTTTE